MPNAHVLTRRPGEGLFNIVVLAPVAAAMASDGPGPLLSWA